MNSASQSRPARRLTRVFETSAGGFVISAENPPRIALIGRINRGGRMDWCVPKGHPEGVESIREAAVREIAEETGLDAEILEELGQIHYEFAAGSKLISKTVHHFIMRQLGGELTVENDPEREADDVRWFSIDELHQVLTHENERRMAQGVIEWIERNA